MDQYLPVGGSQVISELLEVMNGLVISGQFQSCLSTVQKKQTLYPSLEHSSFIPVQPLFSRPPLRTITWWMNPMWLHIPYMIALFKQTQCEIMSSMAYLIHHKPLRNQSQLLPLFILTGKYVSVSEKKKPSGINRNINFLTILLNWSYRELFTRHFLDEFPLLWKKQFIIPKTCPK